jgi:exodeoxyribonuclease VII large subunit
MRHKMDMRVSSMKSRSELLRHKLDALSPLAVLDRGYAIVAAEDGTTVRSVQQVRTGDTVTVTMKDGRIITTTREVING